MDPQALRTLADIATAVQRTHVADLTANRLFMVITSLGLHIGTVDANINDPDEAERLARRVAATIQTVILPPLFHRDLPNGQHAMEHLVDADSRQPLHVRVSWGTRITDNEQAGRDEWLETTP